MSIINIETWGIFQILKYNSLSKLIREVHRLFERVIGYSEFNGIKPFRLSIVLILRWVKKYVRLTKTGPQSKKY